MPHWWWCTDCFNPVSPVSSTVKTTAGYINIIYLTFLSVSISIFRVFDHAQAFKQKPAPDLQTTTQPRCNRTLASACRTPCFDSAPRVKFCAVKGRCERRTFWRFLVVLKEIFWLFWGILWEILVDCSGLKRKNEPFLKKFGFSSGHLEGKLNS